MLIIDRMDYSFLKICIFYTSVPGADSAPDLCSILSRTYKISNSLKSEVLADVVVNATRL